MMIMMMMMKTQNLLRLYHIDLISRLISRLMSRYLQTTMYTYVE